MNNNKHALWNSNYVCCVLSSTTFVAEVNFIDRQTFLVRNTIFNVYLYDLVVLVIDDDDFSRISTFHSIFHSPGIFFILHILFRQKKGPATYRSRPLLGIIEKPYEWCAPHASTFDGEIQISVIFRMKFNSFNCFKSVSKWTLLSRYDNEEFYVFIKIIKNHQLCVDSKR